MPQAWSVLLLAGGDATRLEGADKALLDIDGRSAIDRILEHLPGDVPVIVAGPERPTSRPVTFRPDPQPGGGPVEGIAAALDALDTDIVVVMAVDMPWAGTLVAPLAEQCVDTDDDVIVAVDADGHRQVLFTAWHTDALRRALTHLGSSRDRAVRELVDAARARAWHVPAAASPLLIDVDTPEDLTRARGLARGLHP